METNIKGAGVALVTPFDSYGEIDTDALDRIVEHVICGGVDYIVALGTTAETPTLTGAEKSNVLDRIRQRAAGRVPLVAGVGGNSTAHVMEQLDTLDLSGYSALLSVTPYYNKPSQQGLFEHYKTIARESPIPVMLYNVPSRTGVNMEASTTLRIAYEVDNVLGIKEACGNMPQVVKMIKHRPQGFQVISGDDCLALPFLSVGGDGVISVAANAFPEQCSRMVKDYIAGRCADAVAMHTGLSDIFEALFCEGNPSGVKTALSIKGLCGPHVRLPLVPGSEWLVGKMKELMTLEKFI